MNKSSIVKIVNVTGTEFTVGNVVCPTGVPQVVYRNRTIFGVGTECSSLVEKVTSGAAVVYNFAGEVATMEGLLDTINRINSELWNANNTPSFSANYAWYRTSCLDMLDGLRHQLNLFDFEGVGVTETRPEVVAKMMKVLDLLSLGYLSDAIVEIDSIATATDSDFLSASTVLLFKSLFESAA